MVQCTTSHDYYNIISMVVRHVHALINFREIFTNAL